MTGLKVANDAEKTAKSAKLTCDKNVLGLARHFKQFTGGYSEQAAAAASGTCLENQRIGPQPQSSGKTEISFHLYISHKTAFFAQTGLFQHQTDSLPFVRQRE